MNWDLKNGAHKTQFTNLRLSTADRENSDVVFQQNNTSRYSVPGKLQDVSHKTSVSDSGAPHADTHPGSVDNLSQVLKVAQGQNMGKGYTGGANYRLPEVDEFVKKFQTTYQSTHFSLNANETYVRLAKRLRALRKRGSRLRSYINKKG